MPLVHSAQQHEPGVSVQHQEAEWMQTRIQGPALSREQAVRESLSKSPGAQCFPERAHTPEQSVEQNAKLQRWINRSGLARWHRMNAFSVRLSKHQSRRYRPR